MVQRTVFYRTDAILPLVALVERAALHDASAREAENARVQVFQCLSQVTAHAVLAILVGVHGEQRDVLQRHAVRSLQEDAQLSRLHRLRRCQLDGIFLPLRRGDVQLLLHKLLVLFHRVFLNQLHTDGSLLLAPCSLPLDFSPYREAILLALLHANAEVALVDQSRTTVVVTWVAQHHIVRTTLKGAIVLHLYRAKALPTHQVLGEFERAVLHQLAIQATISGIVDVLEEDTIHR